MPSEARPPEAVAKAATGQTTYNLYYFRYGGAYTIRFPSLRHALVYAARKSIDGYLVLYALTLPGGGRLTETEILAAYARDGGPIEVPVYTGVEEFEFLTWTIRMPPHEVEYLPDGYEVPQRDR